MKAKGKVENRGWGNGWLIHPTKENGYKYIIAAWKFGGKTHKRSTGTKNEKEAARIADTFVAEFKALRERDYTAATNRAIEREQKKVNALEDGERTLSLRQAFEAVASYSEGKIAAGTLAGYRLAITDLAKWLDRYRRPEGADIEMRKIGASTIEEFLKAKAVARVAPQTRSKIALQLKGVFRRIADSEERRVADASTAGRRKFCDLPWARLDIADDKWWQRSTEDICPVLEGEKVEAQTVARQSLTREELRRLLEAAKPGEKWLLFRIGAQTGLRMGDCVTLRFGDNVRLDEGRTGRLVVIPEKTGRRSKAFVDTALGRELHDYLAKLPQAKTKGAFLMPTLAESYLKHAANLSVVVREVFKKAGFETAETVGSCKRRRAVYGFHSLRMTLARFMATANLEAAARALGHSRAGMTTRGYLNGAKLEEDRETEAFAWERWFYGEDEEAAKKPGNVFSVRAGEVGRGDVADAQKAVFDAACAMLANLEPQTLRAVASEALRLAMAQTVKSGAKKAVA